MSTPAVVRFKAVVNLLQLKLLYTWPCAVIKFPRKSSCLHVVQCIYFVQLLLLTYCLLLCTRRLLTIVYILDSTWRSPDGVIAHSVGDGDCAPFDVPWTVDRSANVFTNCLLFVEMARQQLRDVHTLKQCKVIGRTCLPLPAPAFRRPCVPSLLLFLLLHRRDAFASPHLRFAPSAVRLFVLYAWSMLFEQV